MALHTDRVGRTAGALTQDFLAFAVGQPAHLFGPVEEDEIEDEPDEAEDRERDESGPPAPGAGQRRHDNGAESGTEKAAGAPKDVGNAALLRRHPFAHDAAARWDRGGLARAHDEPGGQQRAKTP